MDPENLQAAITAGQNLTQRENLKDGRVLVTAPHLERGHLLVPAPKLADPRFLTANPLINETRAFIDYINQFKVKATRIFYTQEGAFLAVIDYHEGSGLDAKPHHGDHFARLTLLRSPEWVEWSANSEKQMGQQSFAEFIEDNAKDLLVPDPETMLRIASGLHATVGATFRQATNQANGQIQLAFDETINGTVNGKEEAIPTTFQVGLRPFMGCARYPVDCRLRYRIDRSSGAALKLHFKALHLAWITETALEAIVQRIQDETGIAPSLGYHDADAFKRGL